MVPMSPDEEKVPILNVGKRTPVTFWGADGSCYDGAVPKMNGEVVFIESRDLVPVSSEITIRLRPQHEGEVEWGVATGIVLWRCPGEDHFMNRKGFGVCIQSRWSQPSGVSETNGAKEGE